MESNQPSQKDNSSQTEKSTKFLIEQYRVLSDDRINHNELFWNVPLMFLTAQSFLLVIALGGFKSAPWECAIGAFISFMFGFLSIQIFERNRINEIADAELMLDIEKNLVAQGYKGTEIHQPNKNRKYLSGENVDRYLESKKFYRFLNRGISYILWRKGMSLVTAISAVLFFYNIFYYINDIFPYVNVSQKMIAFGSFRNFVDSLDKSAVSIVIILFAINWSAYVLDLIFHEHPNKDMIDSFFQPEVRESLPKKKKLSAKIHKEQQHSIRDIPNSERYPKLNPLYNFFVLESLFIIILFIGSATARQKQESLASGIWMYTLVVFTSALFMYFFLLFSVNRHINSKINGFKDVHTIAIILAGGNSQRLQDEYPLITKFLHVHIHDRTLLEETLLRNNSLIDHHSIVTTSNFEMQIRDLPLIKSYLEHEIELNEEKASIFTLFPSSHNKSPKDSSSSDQEGELKGDLNIIAEPLGRGTATAIYFYLWNSYSNRTSNSEYDPVLMFLPSDHVISDTKSYETTLHQAIKFARVFPHIYLIGIFPKESAASLYGYIKVRDSVGSVLKIDRFIEKPNPEEIFALGDKSLLFWNMGVFIARRSIFMRSFADTDWSSLREFSSCPHNKNEISLLYDLIPESSYEKNVLEHVSNLYVIPASFDWIDVGDPDRLKFAKEKNLCQVDSGIS